MIAKTKGIASVKPAQLPAFYNIGIGGMAGSGKTHLLGTVGAGKKILVFDTEGGTTSFNSKTYLDDEFGTEPDNIDVITFNHITTPQDLVFQVESVLDHLIRSKGDGYSLVAWDSLTQFQALFLGAHEAKEPRKAYGDLQNSLHTLVNKFRAVPVHTIATARLKVAEDDVLGHEIVRFSVSPGVWSIVSGLFDQIGFMTFRTQGVREIRELNFNHTNRAPGKDRMGIGKVSDPKLVQFLQ